LKLLISPGEQTLSPFTIHHSFLLTTHQVKERILTFKIMGQIPMFGCLEVLRLFANFAALSGSILGFPYSLYLSTYLFLSPAREQ